MRLHTRPGTESDLEAIAAIEAASFAKPGVKEAAWTVAALHAELIRPHTRLFVAVANATSAQGVDAADNALDHVDDFIVGYCLLWLVVDEAEILTLAIDPQMRRQGIGSYLLEGVMAAVAQQGAGCMYLDVRESNDAGRALYTRAGFLQIGERKRYYEGRENALLLKRTLTALRVSDAPPTLHAAVPDFRGAPRRDNLIASDQPMTTRIPLSDISAAAASKSGASTAHADAPLDDVDAVDAVSDLNGSTTGADGPKVFVQTFGCQMNVNDTDRMHQVLKPMGYTPTDDAKLADLIILNTCSVRDKAEQKMLSELGRLAPLKEYNDELVLSVAGCVAQQEGEALLKKVPYLDMVFGPDNIGELPELLKRAKSGEKRVAQTKFFKRKDYNFIEATPKPVGQQGVTEFVTIMKGCDKVCTFCIVPFTRGREVSKSPELVVAEVERLVAAGVKEVTLLGQNVNSYGKDRFDDAPGFPDLIRKVDAIPGLERIRFTTSHPMDCSDDLIACFADVPALCEYFHLPVQSGSERVLKLMRRHRTREQYMSRVDGLRERCPDIALSTDIIVGFPGETEKDFQETLSLLREVEYDSIFAFKYSPRPGTKAAEMKDDVSTADKKRRLAEVFAVQNPINAAKIARYGGQTVEVLIEKPSKDMSKAPKGRKTDEFQLMGRTRTNVIVNFPVPAGDFWANRLIGEIANVKVEAVKAHSLYGKLV